MADEFTIESATDDAIRARHLPHGHRYVFAIRKQDGRRLLGRVGPIIGNAKAAVSAMTLLSAARAFAEREARKAGLID
jgi:hypothetical protein